MVSRDKSKWIWAKPVTWTAAVDASEHNGRVSIDGGTESTQPPQKPHPTFIYNYRGWCNYTRKWTRLRYRRKAAGVVCASSLNFDLLCNRPINSADPRSQTVHNGIASSGYTITAQIRFRSKSSAYCRNFVCRRTHHTNHWIGVGHLCAFFSTPLSLRAIYLVGTLFIDVNVEFPANLSTNIVYLKVMKLLWNEQQRNQWLFNCLQAADNNRKLTNKVNLNIREVWTAKSLSSSLNLYNKIKLYFKKNKLLVVNLISMIL